MRLFIPHGEDGLSSSGQITPKTQDPDLVCPKDSDKIPFICKFCEKNAHLSLAIHYCLRVLGMQIENRHKELWCLWCGVEV